jgi:myosin heavy subunit
MRVPLIPSAGPLQVLVEFSDDPFIASVVKTALTAAREEAAAAASATAEGPGKGSKMKSGKFVGVVDGFKTSLTSLITTLQMGDLHFIRCLKPNDKKAANEWDRPVASRQLLSAGLVSAVSATRSGYTDHLLPHNIIGNFGPLAPDVPTVGKADVETAKAVLEACGITKEQYSVGKTKVFLRQGVLSELQRKRLEHIGQHATLVQCSIRRRLARRMYQKLKEEAQRKADEKRRREEELRRQREEGERRRLEAQRTEEERRRKAEEEERERRKQVQKARSLSFERKRRKKQEEEECKVRDEVAAREGLARKWHEEAGMKGAGADARMQASLEAAGVSIGVPVSERSAAANAAALNELKERGKGASLIRQEVRQDVDASLIRQEVRQDEDASLIRDLDAEPGASQLKSPELKSPELKSLERKSPELIQQHSREMVVDWPAARGDTEHQISVSKMIKTLNRGIAISPTVAAASPAAVGTRSTALSQRPEMRERRHERLQAQMEQQSEASLNERAAALRARLGLARTP